MSTFEIWVSARPITFHGEIIDWKYGKSHYVSSSRTFCGKPVFGDTWERASSRTGFSVDCALCLTKTKK